MKNSIKNTEYGTIISNSIKGTAFLICAHGLIPIPIGVKNKDIVNYIREYERKYKESLKNGSEKTLIDLTSYQGIEDFIKEAEMFGWSIYQKDDKYYAKFKCNHCGKVKEQFIELNLNQKGVHLPIYCDDCRNKKEGRN